VPKQAQFAEFTQYVWYRTYTDLYSLYSASGFFIGDDAMISLIDLQKNKLLAKLPEATLLRWLPLVEVVEMPLGQVLQESKTHLSHVYFPTSALVSLQYVMRDGSPIEFATVGNEGIIGISVYLGGESTPSRAEIQRAGIGFRLCGRVVKDEFNRAGPVLQVLLSYAQELITQMSRSAVSGRSNSSIKPI